jgi:hypothetical protein
MQTTNNILLVRPSNFVFNPETAVSNAFQSKVNESDEAIRKKVFAEFEAMVAALKSKGVNVFVFDDTPSPQKPDAIFPNNWVTFHPDGTVILYPMCAVNRRYERRPDIIESLKKNFSITKVTDLSGSEKENKFLEGTGSIVFDHDNKIAYACLSPRTDKDLFIRLCVIIKYKPVYFLSHDNGGKEIYHTNVMMCVGERFAVICSASITDLKERESVISSLSSTGHKIVDISFDQMNRFAGNMLAIRSNVGKSLLVLSKSSYDSLTAGQKKSIEEFTEMVPVSIHTIETIGGGSARCMMAEIFLKPLQQ